MTAGQRVIARPAFAGQTAAVVLAATFAIGVVTGLAVPLVHLAAAPRATTSTPSSVTSAWLSYRQGERALPVVASQIGDPTWRTYRQDERSSAQAPGSAATFGETWQLYRQGERTP